ncbi:hypothetical protein BGZ51_005885 [Haplosporangium sp. Z 767]|nr:hypothetical protein BGZ51_005885 [Haplosporangium sp. Z 767]
MPDHFYTTDPKLENAPQKGYAYEGITGYLYPNPTSWTVPLFHWFRSTVNAGEHFYTTDAKGEQSSVSEHSFEGVTGYLYPNAVRSGLVPLYRWYHPQRDVHFYTTDRNGEFSPSSGYKAEGIIGYLYIAPQDGTVPLHRFYKE